MAADRMSEGRYKVAKTLAKKAMPATTGGSGGALGNLMNKTTKKPTPTPRPIKKMTPEDKAYADFMKRYNYDITKVPGFKKGKGTV